MFEGTCAFNIIVMIRLNTLQMNSMLEIKPKQKEDMDGNSLAALCTENTQGFA